MAPGTDTPARPRFRTWVCWAVCVYAVWAALAFTGGRWDRVVEHWPIAVAMTLGSYVAGSTPMGGGTIGFATLVLLQGAPAEIGRHFSFAVQAVGMTSASIFIVSRRQRIDWRFLAWTTATCAVATPLGLFALAPHVPGVYVKALFACLWASFGLLHLARIRAVIAMDGRSAGSSATARVAAMAAGVLGGLIASVMGSGVELLVYMALVVLFRVDVKIAIPTAVMAAAFTSIVGIGVSLAQGVVGREVLDNWLAAVPIVVLGAPLGALVVQLVSRRPTLLIVSALCVGQFVWTLSRERLTPAGLAGAAGLVVALLAALCAMDAWGARRAATGGA